MDFSARKAILFLATTVLSASLYAQSPNNYFVGPYVGLNAGYSWAYSNTTTTLPFTPNSYFFTIDGTQIKNLGANSLRINNFIGGIETGYNFQYGAFIIGPEIDFDSNAGSASKTQTTAYISSPGSTFTMYTKTKSTWLATLRPRVGYVVNRMMFYVTGGVAFAQLKTYNTFSDNFLVGTPAPSNAYATATQSQVKAGGVFGAGMEYAVLDNVFIKAEYLYATFGNVTSNSPLSLNPAYLAGFTPPLATQAPFNNSANYSTNIIRFGIDYKFA